MYLDIVVPGTSIDSVSTLWPRYNPNKLIRNGVNVPLLKRKMCIINCRREKKKSAKAVFFLRILPINVMLCLLNTKKYI